MRRSLLVMLAMLTACASSAAAQYSVTATAEITGTLTPMRPTLDVRASAGGVSVRELLPQRSGTLLLERTFVDSTTPAAASRAVWVRDAAGLRREERTLAAPSAAIGVELGGRTLDVPLDRGRVVTVTKVVAANS